MAIEMVLPLPVAAQAKEQEVKKREEIEKEQQKEDQVKEAQRKEQEEKEAKKQQEVEKQQKKDEREAAAAQKKIDADALKEEKKVEREAELAKKAALKKVLTGVAKRAPSSPKKLLKNVRDNIAAEKKAVAKAQKEQERTLKSLQAAAAKHAKAQIRADNKALKDAEKEAACDMCKGSGRYGFSECCWCSGSGTKAQTSQFFDPGWLIWRGVGLAEFNSLVLFGVSIWAAHMVCGTCLFNWLYSHAYLP